MMGGLGKSSPLLHSFSLPHPSSLLPPAGQKNTYNSCMKEKSSFVFNGAKCLISLPTASASTRDKLLSRKKKQRGKAPSPILFSSRGQLLLAPSNSSLPVSSTLADLIGLRLLQSLDKGQEEEGGHNRREEQGYNSWLPPSHLTPPRSVGVGLSLEIGSLSAHVHLF